MAHPFFHEIDKFEAWARIVLREPPKISAEWETDYPDWGAIDEHFKDFIRSVPTSTWSTEVRSRLDYIIARDIEDGRLLEALPDDALALLAEHALICGEKNTRWQMALALPRMADTNRAIELMERYAEDPDGEVKKVALCALAAAREGRVVTYEDLVRQNFPS
ncbi:MAG TPA: hypothetical protein PLR96_08300 [Flavobacteriales bacterium]|nr:hypothetical protein [Flavobacteriales bacterium]